MESKQTYAEKNKEIQQTVQETVEEKKTLQINGAEQLNESPAYSNGRLFKKYEEVKKNMPESYSATIYKLKQDMDAGIYTAVGRKLKGKRIKNEKENKHSDTMSAVLDKVEKLHQVHLKKVDPDNLNDTVEELLTLYQDIILSAMEYVKSHSFAFSSEGRARRDMILRIRDQAAEERLKLSGNAKVIASQMKDNPDLSYTYEDLIRENKVRKLKAGEGGVKEVTTGGAGTSELIVIKMENGQSMYMRKSESIKKSVDNPIEYVEDAKAKYKDKIDSLKEKAGSSPEEAENLKKEIELQEEKTKIADQFIAALNKLKKPDKKLTKAQERKYADQKKYGLHYIASHGVFGNISELGKMMLSASKVGTYPGLKGIFDIIREVTQEDSYKAFYKEYTKITDEISDLDENKLEDQQKIAVLQQKAEKLAKEYEKTNSKAVLVKQVMRDFALPMNQFDFATGCAKIKAGSNISDRNVATSILARALGIKDMVAESELVEAEVNGKKIRGVSMEGVEGESTFDKIDESLRDNKEMRYSPLALKQLHTLQVFDIICGQIDRKGDNYISKFEENEKGQIEMKSLKAIDNDMAFGNIRYEDLWKKKGFMTRMAAMDDKNGDMRMAGLDKEFADRVLALKPESIDFLLAGILTEEERECTKDRLVHVQEIIKRQKKQDAYLKKKKMTPKICNDADWKKINANLLNSKSILKSCYGSYMYINFLYKIKKK